PPPWDSPKVVTRNKCPKVEPIAPGVYGRHGPGTRAMLCRSILRRDGCRAQAPQAPSAHQMIHHGDDLFIGAGTILDGLEEISNSHTGSLLHMRPPMHRLRCRTRAKLA